jgi:hypothetical protein
MAGSGQQGMPTMGSFEGIKGVERQLGRTANPVDSRGMRCRRGSVGPVQRLDVERARSVYPGLAMRVEREKRNIEKRVKRV